MTPTPNQNHINILHNSVKKIKLKDEIRVYYESNINIESIPIGLGEALTAMSLLQQECDEEINRLRSVIKMK